MRNETARMMNECKILKNRNMVKSDLYDILIEIGNTYACAYAKTTDDDDGEYNYFDDVITIEGIFDEIVEYLYDECKSASDTRRLNRRIYEVNRIRDHYYPNDDHISYKF